jgi:hypothetical protein
MSAPTTPHVIAPGPELEAFTRYAHLVIRKRELASETKEIERQLRTLEPGVLSYLCEGGFEKVKVEGYTLSPHREPWVYPAAHATEEQVIQALKACGMAQYVRESYSTKSLTTYVRQLEEAAGTTENSLELLPAELAAVIELKPSFRVQVLKTWR